MPTNYVMVDFENTQPESLDEIPIGAFKIKVFVGAAQVKARGRTRFFMSMHRHAPHSEYVEMTRSGPNAMDMHIAYFIGQLLAKEPEAVIYIVSKDKDFDPLIEFLDRHGGRCIRVKSIAEIVKQKPAAARPAAPPKQPASGARPPPPKSTPKVAPKAVPPKPAAAKPAPPPKAGAAGRKTPANHIDGIVKHLRSMTGGRPSKRKALAQTIAGYFKHHGGTRGEREVEQVIAELLRRGFISLDGTKVGYTLGA